MRVLQAGMGGGDVAAWQSFLIRLGEDPGEPDGDFGPRTLAATRAFQGSHGLADDGVVGPATLARALALGFDPLEWPADADHAGPFWPPRPAGLRPLVTFAERAAVFEAFEYEPAPTADDPEAIRVLGDWVSRNVASVELPQLAGVAGAPSSYRVQFHRKAQGQLRDLWRAWEAAGFLRQVLSWGGSYAPRFVRGSHSSLSNHAFASAFDVNVRWNGFGRPPARVGQEGSVRELVPIANDHGFYWGGHFSRPDGMHFEIARLQ